MACIALTLSLLSFAPLALAQSSSVAAVSPATAAAATPTGASTLTFTLASTNPAAKPLSSIAATGATAATNTVTASRTSNTIIPSAPALPNAASLQPASYPALDKLPPTDSDQVKAWIEEVKKSGITIPGWGPNTSGDCASNAEAAADPDRCWWTCSGCTRDTDVTACNNKNTWGLTYDDGPSYYTPDLLNYLEQEKLKATFFAVGSRVISFPALAQQEYLGGHQVGVHTWSHPYLTTLTNEQIIAELGWTRKVIKDTLGVTPNTMRPPFGDIDDRVRAISLALGLTPVMWTRLSPTVTFDTGDFDVHAGLITSQQVMNNWEGIVANASQLDTGFIVLEHDLFQQTVELATGYILPDAIARGLKIQSVIECIDKTIGDAYVETNTTGVSAANTTTSSSKNSTSSGASSNSAPAHAAISLPVTLALCALLAAGVGL